MRTVPCLSARFPAWKIASVGALLLMTASAQPSRAQMPGGYPPTGQSPYAPPPPSTPPTSLPEGVDQLFALLGTNMLVALATPDGYDRLRELVRNIDGDLDLIQTRVVSVAEPTAALTALGMTVNSNTAAVSTTDGAKLLTALQNHQLRVNETLRITTRENTPVDALLRGAGTRSLASGTPFTLIAREAKDGTVTLEIAQPVSAEFAVRNGQTAIVAFPSPRTDTVCLLFLTAAVLPRAAH